MSNWHWIGFRVPAQRTRQEDRVYSQGKESFSIGYFLWTLICLIAMELLSLESLALGILIPAYFSPGTQWSALNRAAERVPLIAIMNPANGPGNASNNGYVTAINSLKRSKGRVIGYVHTSYTARSLDAVRGDIDRYYAYYDIDGIFVDEMTNDSNAQHLSYYASLYEHIKGKNHSHLVIGNPGINAPAAYITRPAADTLVTFEHHTGYDKYVPDVWTRTEPSTVLVHLCYAVTNSATMTNYLNLVVARNVGYDYITDDGGNNPWGRLASYWLEEIDLIEKINRAAARDRRARLDI
jgi:hypothetical protein